MLDQLRQKQLTSMLINLKDKEERAFRDFKAEEQQFIMQRIIRQNGSKGFCIETNNSGLKFRKRVSWWNDPQIRITKEDL